ncbi:dihydrofolate reductase family protein [Leptolyngbya sp. 15MV]|nr:dihydrofolate reductase family protein [Leptolyngbya sp. 15MV]
MSGILARYDALGGGTWRADAPRLDVRLPGLEGRSPHRAVLTSGDAPEGVIAIRAPRDIALLDDVQYLYLEGGAGAATAFLEHGLVDRIELYRAPVRLDEGVPAPADFAPASLAAANGGWQLAERRQLGSDTFEAWDRPAADSMEG